MQVVLAAHSLGNLQLLYCFQRVFGTEILSRIKSLVSIAAPWAGSPQAPPFLAPPVGLRRQRL